MTAAKVGGVGVLAFLSTILGLGGLVVFGGSQYSVQEGRPYKRNGSPYTSFEICAVMVGVVAASFQPFLWCAFLLGLKQGTSTLRNSIAYAGLAVFHLAVGTYYGVVWGSYLINCGLVRCAFQDDMPIGKGYRPVVGLFTLVFHLLLACCCVMLIVKNYMWAQRTHLPEPLDSVLLPIEGGYSMCHDLHFRVDRCLQRYRRQQWRASLSSFLNLTLLLPLFMALTACLPNTFEYMSPNKMASRQLQGYVGGAEVTGSLFRTLLLPVSFISGSSAEKESFYLAFYPDVLLFYGFLYLLIVFGVMQKTWPTLRSLLTRRLGGVSLNDLCVAFLFCLEFIAQLIYWGFHHNWKQRASRLGAADCWARAFGQLAVVCLALLFLPVTRNSALTRMLGISWEMCLHLHRVLGRLFLLMVTLHFVMFIVVYASKDCLQDLWSFRPKYKLDDWTVPLMTYLCYIAIPAFVLTTLNIVRRKFYHLFWVTHLLYAPLVIGSLFHAHSAWYFLIGPLFLWICDRCYRLAQKATPVDVFRVSMVDEVTGFLSFFNDQTHRVFGFFRRSFMYSPGQYAFFTISEISLFENHPFTMVSSPFDHHVDFYIAIVEKEKPSWTEDAVAAIREGPEGIHMSVEGPYGFDLFRFVYDVQHVVLVGGGAAATPCISMLRSLLQMQLTDFLPGSLQSVALFSRFTDVEKVLPYMNTFALIPWANTARRIFSATICCRIVDQDITLNRWFQWANRGTTSPVSMVAKYSASASPSASSNYVALEENRFLPGSASLSTSVNLQEGNLELERVRDHLMSIPSTQLHRVLVFGCGRDSLMDPLKEMCTELGTELHVETFDF
ncbi:MAG: hypothetical protein KVP17_000739 [Porospora cf. gigantea B]|uniref:uncharacterized protein n=1 Tax=Porospora cf. gigantea B TaxID=2853592 RepID=UPI0035718D30|nr:MAG: hypothetical protein KVP17_000739 [Porospora cf. gigantea B]